MGHFSDGNYPILEVNGASFQVINAEWLLFKEEWGDYPLLTF